MTTTDHTVTVTWEGGYPSYKFECSAPADALCRAQWTCDCESWAFAGVRDGIPWHSHVDADDPLSPSTERHTGKFGDECNLRDWFDNTDEPLEGSVTIPVHAIFEVDYYRFEVQG